MEDRATESFVHVLNLISYIILNVRDRSHVIVSSVESVVAHEKDENTRPYYAAPIHVARCWVWSSREELKYPEHREEAQCNDVNRIAGSTKAESRSWERFPAESLLEDTWDL